MQVIYMFFGALIGAIIGGFIATWQENSKLPNIEISPGEPGDGDGSRRFLHLKITNFRREGIWQKLSKGNKPALLCKVLLEFLDPGDEHQLFAIQARWVSTAEPVIPSIGSINFGTFSPQHAFEAETENILTSENKPIDVAIKYEGKKEFHGFNNWSYLHPDFKNPDWEVKTKTVLVRAHFSCDSLNISKLFKISNPDKQIASFKVEEV